MEYLVPISIVGSSLRDEAVKHIYISEFAVHVALFIGTKGSRRYDIDGRGSANAPVSMTFGFYIC